MRVCGLLHIKNALWLDFMQRIKALATVEEASANYSQIYLVTTIVIARIVRAR
jgi:hypothetical protein